MTAVDRRAFLGTTVGAALGCGAYVLAALAGATTGTRLFAAEPVRREGGQGAERMARLMETVRGWGRRGFGSADRWWRSCQPSQELIGTPCGEGTCE
jgi:hypothetical protein